MKSASQYDEFDRRMRRITRRHTQLSRGYVTTVNDDGLVVAKPKRKFSRGTLRGVAIVVLLVAGLMSGWYIAGAILGGFVIAIPLAQIIAARLGG